MRIRLFAIAVTLFIFVFHLPSGFQLAHQLPDSGLSLSQNVAVEVLNLERNMQRTKSDCQKNDLIDQTIMQIEKIKSQFPAQFRGEEKQYLSFMKKIKLQQEQQLEGDI